MRSWPRLIPCLTVLAVVLLGLSAALHAQSVAQGNLVPNPSFEVTGDDGMPVGWHFMDVHAGAKAIVDDTVAHTGKRSVKLTNPHGQEPHVYGTFTTRLNVKPNQIYTLSLYARSQDPGAAWFGCGPKWERRMGIKPTGDQWQRFTLTFTTQGDEKQLEPRINVDSRTDGLWIDSVQLEEGPEATEFQMPIMLERGQTMLQVRPAVVGENLLLNGSFEELRNGMPAFWRFDKRNTDATMTVDESCARSGRRSIKLTNGTPLGAHVYAQMLYAEPVKVRPGTTYTLSAYVLVGDSPGIAWVGGADRWRVRVYFPRASTNGQWVRVQQTFTTEANETEIRIMVITESPTRGVWVDDVKLEEGAEATPFVLEAAATPRLEVDVAGRGRLGTPVNPWEPDKYPSSSFVFGRELWVTGYAMNAAGKTLRVRLSRQGQLLDEQTAAVPADAACAYFEFARELSETPGGEMRVEVTADGIAEATRSFDLITEPRIRERLATLRPHIEELRERVKALGPRDAYPKVTLTIADNFLVFIDQDLQHGELARAWGEVDDVERIVRRALGQTQYPEAPKYVTSPVEISGPSFIGTLRWPDGREQRGPVIFIGMGPFGQARRDTQIFPNYGFNVMQVEFGPNSVLPSETEYSDNAIREFLDVCDRAAKAGVQVNLLISPHYFPAWALEKWPHLKDCGGGFFRYCVHAPEARQVLERYLRYMIPKVKDHPALHSICLSNEPLSLDLQNCGFVRANWHAWLKAKHGSIDRVNELWGSKYGGFDEIPVPPPVFRPDPMVYDFVRYNQEEFAGFHRFLAETIHEMAPGLPVHAKMMICAVFGPSAHGPWSIAPELFGEFCEINGNDAWRVYLPQGEWATSWQDEIMGYELQRCAREAPVFNSEDHIIPDRNVNWQSPTYIYNVYWQGAVHGRGASSAWVWERTYDPASDFSGSILHRAECIEAIGHCTLDANRLSDQITALQQVKPPVAIVYALSGFVYQPGYAGALSAAWRCSAFCGIKTGFVFERQLEALADGRKLGGYLSECRVIVLAGLRNLSARACEGLRSFVADGGKLVAVGEPPMVDEYGRPVEPALPVAVRLESTKELELMARLREALSKVGVAPPVELIGQDGQPVYGVEHFAAPWQGGWLVNVSNYRREEPTANLRVGGRAVTSARNLISGHSVAFPDTIPSLQPLLLEVK